MIDRLKIENVILVADRGYENYNIFAHAIEKGWKFAIRIKDKNSNGIASRLNFPPNDEFDIDITQIFSRENTTADRNHSRFIHAGIAALRNRIYRLSSDSDADGNCNFCITWGNGI